MKKFDFDFTENAKNHLYALKKDKGRQHIYKAVGKTLYFMQTNLRHPSLNTHEYSSLKGDHGEKVFESYAQNKTPGAYRIFWHYGPKKNYITIIALVSHP